MLASSGTFLVLGNSSCWVGLYHTLQQPVIDNITNSKAVVLTDFPCDPFEAGITTLRDGLEPFPSDEGLPIATGVADWLLAELSSPPLLLPALALPDRGEEESLLPSFM